LLILDLGLPGMDGTEVLEELRGQGEQIPIIILTARDEVKDKVSGLEGGANDYVTKPFSFEELLARIRLQLRQTTKNEHKSLRPLTAGNIMLELRSRTVKVGDRRIELSNQEFILLDTLMRHPNQALSREQLLNYVWGYDYEASSNIVDVYIGYLRKKLGRNLIETVRGVGYMLRKL
ncbi:MAG: response regulator transcription factor, partial [Xenococcus sp. (in: cyanobacteria)]